MYNRKYTPNGKIPYFKVVDNFGVELFGSFQEWERDRKYDQCRSQGKSVFHSRTMKKLTTD